MNDKQCRLFALFCMTFDHTTRIFPLHRLAAPLADWLWAAGYPAMADWVLGDFLYGLQYIGRMAAPIYLFCAARGFCHTRDVRGYLRRLLLTAAVSQAPYTLFELAEYRAMGAVWDWRDTQLNILFTLALGLLALAAYDRLSRHYGRLPGLLAPAMAALLARLLDTEGREGYILLIFVFYFTRDLPRRQRALLFLPAAALARWGLVWWTVTEFSATVLRNCVLNVLGNYLGMLAVLFYREEAGSAGKGFRRLMYIFYPAHLALLAAAGFLI